MSELRIKKLILIVISYAFNPLSHIVLFLFFDKKVMNFRWLHLKTFNWMNQGHGFDFKVSTCPEFVTITNLSVFT